MFLFIAYEILYAILHLCLINKYFNFQKYIIYSSFSIFFNFKIFNKFVFTYFKKLKIIMSNKTVIGEFIDVISTMHYMKNCKLNFFFFFFFFFFKARRPMII